MTPSARLARLARHSGRWLMIALCAGVCVGCSAFQRGTTGFPATGGIRPLSGDELILDEAHPQPFTWITARHSLRLSYQPATWTLPRKLVFVYRAHGESQWLLGPTWTPGQTFPAWSPPREGAWELRAQPYMEAIPVPPPADLPSQCVVICDWTPPRVLVEKPLPEHPLTGGGRVVLRWHAEDDFPGGARVNLEMAQGVDGNWESLREIPNAGIFEWDVPNRPLAAARVRLRVLDAAGNVTLAEIPGRLTVYSRAPVVKVPTFTEMNTRHARLPYEIQFNDGVSLRRIELWLTRDGGQSWNLVGYDHDLRSPFELRLDEGRYGVTLVAEDGEGNRSTYPAPGDPPMGAVIVDWTAPVVEWGEVRVRPIDQLLLDGSILLEVRLPYRIIDDTLDVHSLEFAYKAGGSAWIRLDGDYGPEGAVRWQIPKRVAEPVVVRARGTDRLGNGFSVETRLYPREILDPPRLELVEHPGGWIRGGVPQTIRWNARWEWAAPEGMSVFYRVAEDESWQTLASGLDVEDLYVWQVPEQNLTHLELRVTMRSIDGRELAVIAPEKISIDSDAPVVQLLGPSSGHGEQTAMLLEAFDRGGSQIGQIELFVRRQGTVRWDYAGSVQGDTDTIVFRPPAPGRYELWPVATDVAGNRSVLPEVIGLDEAFVFTAEIGPPGVELENFQDGGTFAGGSRHPIFIGWRGPTTLGGIVSLEYSADDGGTWHDIGRFQLGAQRHLWTLPNQDIARCRLRVIAREVTGRRTIDTSHVPFAIDVTAPALSITRVIDGVDGLTIIQFEPVEPGTYDLAKVWLYISRNEGRHWQQWDSSFPADLPITVELAPGNYGFALKGEDLVGNVEDPPTPGGQPQVFAQVGPTRGVSLTLLNPQSGTFGGGTRHYIFWQLEVLDMPFAERPVRLEYRVKGEDEWLRIADGLPREGKTAWTVPELDGANMELRAVAFDLNGNRYEGSSAGSIIVDSQVPMVLFLEPSSSNRRPTVFEYRLARPDSLAAVELWTRAVSTPEWKLTAVAPIGERLAAEIPDGMYRVALVGVDKAGNRGQPPAVSELGQSDLLVDTVPPVLHVDGVGERHRVFRERDWFVVRPRVQDRHVSPFPLAFRFSDDGGAHYATLKRYHPNGEEFSWRLPDRPGFYQLEVTAEDLAGNKARQVIPVQVVATAPRVTLLTNPSGALLMGGSELQLEWESEGVDPLHRGVSIEFSIDGIRWERALDELTADGSVRWKLPAVDSNRCRVRIMLEREDGLRGEDQSGPFTISTTHPRVRVKDIRPSPEPK